MKESDYTTCHEADKGEKDKVFDGSDELEMKQEASQELDLENNCLTGIKWPPENQPQNDGKKRTVLNGFRKIKAGIVTHGGRTSKLPARYLETDSESEGTLKQKRIRSRKDDLETSGERSIICKSTSKRKICKNGRTEPLQKKTQKVIKRRRSSKSCCEADGDVGIHENGDSNFDATQSTEPLSNLSKTLPNTLKRNFYSSRSDTESSGGETPRKRGRTPKNSGYSTKKARGKTTNGKMDVNDSPHGDCCVSATNANLTSPNLKPKKKKRKLLNGLRSASFLQGVSSDDSSSEYSPKKRGRPPKHSYSTKNNDTFTRDHSSKNGVRKPWVRPLLKSLHKRALYQSHEEHLGNFLSSSEQKLTKAQLGKLVARKCTNGEVIKPKRGRPSQLDLLRREQAKELYSFTDEDDCVDLRKYNGHVKKMKKLKKSKKFGKRPLAASKVNKAEKLLANKLKKKAIKRAAQKLSEKQTETLDSSDNVCNNSSESLQSRRRQRNKIDRVLGMRLNTTGSYEYLVQWKDGTSCWTSSDQAADYELDLKEFLGHEYQDICSVNRLVFKAYYEDNLDKVHSNLFKSDVEAPCTSDYDTISEVEEEEDDDDDDELFSDADDIFDKDRVISEIPVVKPKKRGRKPQECNIDREFVCKEVSVQKLKDCTHITVSRSSGKQMRVNLRIIDSLTLALEEAAVDPSDTVVISGLGDNVFCGVDLETIVTVPLEGEVKNYRKDVDKIRYLYYNMMVVVVI